MSLFRTKQDSGPQEYFPDAWDARLHDAIFQPSRVERRRRVGYWFEFPLIECETEIGPPLETISHIYKSQFKMWLSDMEFVTIRVELSVINSLSSSSTESFPFGFADFGWEWPDHRRIPKLTVRLFEKDGLVERVNRQYRYSRLLREKPVVVSLGLDLDHLASVDREQCWGDWREFESEGRPAEPGECPGRLSVRVIDFRFQSRC